ncbi:MAG: MarR family winged helix-turn-helix transcriptional regulator [Asticcacaulis sp.]
MLSRTHQGFRARMMTALDGTGLHLGHIAILGVLSRTNDRSQKELCHLTGIEKSSMVLFLDMLETEGWVTRMKDPTDRRAHLVHLTPESLARLAPVGARLNQAEADNLSVLTEDERLTLAGLLSRICDHVWQPSAD